MSGVNERSADVDIDLGSLFSAIGRNWARIAAFTLLVTGLAAAYALTATPKYRADAKVMIGQQESVFTRPETQQIGNDPLIDREGVTSQVEVMRSSAFLSEVVASLSERQLAELEDPGLLDSITGILAVFGLAGDQSEATVEQQAVVALREKLDIYAVDNSRIIVVSYSSKNPQDASDVSNKLVNGFLKLQRDAKLATTSDASNLLKTEIDKLETSLSQADADVAAFRAQSGLLIGQNNSVLATQELAEISSELSRVRASRASAKARAEAVASAIANGTSLDALPEVLNSELIRRLREREVQLRSDIADLSVTLLDGHPRIKALRSQLADLQEQIRREASKVQRGLEQEAATAQLREQELTREVNRLKAASAQAGEQEPKLKELERKAQILRETLESYQTRYRQALTRKDQEYAPADAKIFEAKAPTEPVAPKKAAIIGAAFAGSLLLSMIVTMLSELFSGRAMRPARVPGGMVHEVPMTARVVAESGEGRVQHRSQDTAHAAAMAAAALAEEDIIHETDEAAAPTEADPMMMVPPLKPTTRRRAQEAKPAEHSSIRILAERIVAGGLQRVVAVSPEGNDASAASILLARFIADTGLRTLMVDLTATGVVSAATLEGAKAKGVTDILCGEAQFGDIIHPDAFSEAHVVPIGTANAARAIRAIERLPIIVNALNTAYEMVVIECGATDPQTVDRLVGDSTVLVMNTVDPESEAVAESAAEFVDFGFEDVVMVTLAVGDDPGYRGGRTQAA